MKYSILILLMLLTGCIGVPVKRNFPDVPDELMKECDKLTLIDVGKNITLSEFEKIVAGNYTKYHQCQKQMEGWHEWYKEQSKNFNKL